MPVTFADLLRQLTTNVVFLSGAATLLTGALLRAIAAARPGWTVPGNHARWVAIAVAGTLALAAYGVQAAQGTVPFTDEGLYQVVLVVVGGSQTLYSGYKAVKGAVTPNAPDV